MRWASILFAFAGVGCISKPQQINADHLVATNGTVSLQGIHSVRFQTKDGFLVSTSGGIGELTVGETKVCGPLSLYRTSANVAMPSWAQAPAWATGVDHSEFRSFTLIDCIARDNIASTTMTVQRTDAAASAACVALLPLCVLAHSAPGQ